MWVWGFANPVKIVPLKVADRYIEPSKLKTIGLKRIKYGLKWSQEVLLLIYDVLTQFVLKIVL